jgi:hypothetical protein
MLDAGRAYRKGVETLDAGGASREGVKTLDVAGVNQGGGGNNGLQSTPPLLEVDSEQGVVRNEGQKASFMMQFSSQSLTASYHCLGMLSKGRPVVRHATWSWIFVLSPCQNLRMICDPLK